MLPLDGRFATLAGADICYYPESFPPMRTGIGRNVRPGQVHFYLLNFFSLPMSPDDFKEILRSGDFEQIADDVLLAGPVQNFSQFQMEAVATTLAAKFGIQRETVKIKIVGSGKLGFSLLEKRDRNTGNVLPQFRPFSAISDIDVAVISPTLFGLVWDELAKHADLTARMPWNSGQLGDYMVHGWLRPDHFPKNVRLRRCDDWWDVFRTLSASRAFGLRKIRGALYHSHDQLRRYQIRGLRECQLQLMSKI